MGAINYILIWVLTTSLVFLYYCKNKFGITVSISANWYMLKEENKQWMFIAFILNLCLSFLIIGILMKVIWFCVAAVLLVLVALFPAYKKEAGKSKSQDTIEEYLHVFGATGAIIIALIAIYTKFNYKKLCEKCAKITYYMYSKKIQNSTYWIELTALIFILCGIFLYNNGML